jgi:NADH:ubiquinone oxidoreductase subunit 5 (subunit L)/multisubunit Na+/H+ antiporter MnhA subunit
MTSSIPILLLSATLFPFFSFWLILLAGPKMKEKSAAYVATGAILAAALLSYVSMGIWLAHHWPTSGHVEHESHSQETHAANSASVVKTQFVSYLTDPTHKTSVADSHNKAEHDSNHNHAGHGHEVAIPPVVSGVFYSLGKFGKLNLDFSYYVDTLTLCMFCMVTLIASCIHFYASGYMADELSDVHDHEVKLSNGQTLVRPGRFFRFFQYLSLFCFSMLGLVLAGNIALVFVFWELVGICSYFLIGFYIERNSASTAANKAFIVNRVGDFGMIIGLMAIWSSLGTFSFGDAADGTPGLFSLVRSPDNHYALVVPDGMIQADAGKEIGVIARQRENQASPKKMQNAIQAKVAELREKSKHGGKNYGYWMLIVGGIGIFCGCVGKSAQFPLHVWLPDAMEGPTPVSALVHSATMVAAGVYLVGRFYPVFAPEVLLVIASVGCITLFMAATIAITAVDIKRVLAYSTVSQLGYMMLSLGVGGWRAGLMHLITHAFFKSLLFMCSGSVIHAVHTNDMRKMGGLLHKMPVTAITMLIGCLAIAGVGVPFVIGFSGYYSKDNILEQAFALYLTNGSTASGIFFFAACGGAAITAFYMFRMWYMTFVGTPRDQEKYDHAHESPPVMYMPLVILSVFAISVAWNFTLIGYFAIASGFFVITGLQRGWFKSASHNAHGHDSHGHDSHNEHSHGHESHAADQHHAVHDSHSHAEHGHDHSHNHGGLDITWRWVGVMLLCSLLGGGIVQGVLQSPAIQSISVVQSLTNLTLANLLEQARPAGTASDMSGVWIPWTWPNEHTAHEPAMHYKVVVPVTLLATSTWILGIGLATLLYACNVLNPAEVRSQFQPIYNLLWNKWWFDELYDATLVQPCHVAARCIAGIDKNWIDGFLHAIAGVTVWFSKFWEQIADRTIVDGTVNLLADWLYSFGLSLRALQTGRLRQYVMFIVMGALALFVLASFWSSASAQ